MLYYRAFPFKQYLAVGFSKKIKTEYGGERKERGKKKGLLFSSTEIEDSN